MPHNKFSMQVLTKTCQFAGETKCKFILARTLAPLSVTHGCLYATDSFIHVKLCGAYLTHLLCLKAKTHMADS